MFADGAPEITSDIDMMVEALEYASLGYPVFPCVPGAKNPLTPHGLKDATTDERQIREWWNRWPYANVAIATEGLVVVDVDGPYNPWLAEKQDLLAGVPNSLTPRGGSHFFFRQLPGRILRNTVEVMAPKVDTRANGGYVVVPPSYTEDGREYAWALSLGRRDDLPEPPDWLVQLLDAAGRASPIIAAPAAGAEGSTSTASYESSATGIIPKGQRNNTLTRVAGVMRRAGLGEAEIFAALERVNDLRCQPPLPVGDVSSIAKSVARYTAGPAAMGVAVDALGGSDPIRQPVLASDLCSTYPNLRPPVIKGLLREGEIMNMIASPKTGKSWLGIGLAMAGAAGTPWLDFEVAKGAVLLIDNELHQETIANRISRMAEALKLPPDAWQDGLHVLPLRGNITDLSRMAPIFCAPSAQEFNLIILDAFYRCMPAGMDENDNGAMVEIYNIIDRYAARSGASIVLIHHTTKGYQVGKQTTDIGAGAGAQSRAADTHMVLRPHAVDGCLVVEAVTRSYPSPAPFVIRQQFPLWFPDKTLDPTDLKKPNPKGTKADGGSTPKTPPPPEWTPERFAGKFLAPESKSKPSILVAANEDGVSDNLAEKLLRKAEALGLVYRWKLDGNRCAFATLPQPTLPLRDEPPAKSSSRPEIEALLRSDPSLGVREVARRCDVSPAYVSAIRKEMRA